MENIFFENIDNVFGRGVRMNRQEFMKRLEELLTDISTEEKEEALAYYTGYFEDAGEENEEKIIQELEKPIIQTTYKLDIFKLMKILNQSLLLQLMQQIHIQNQENKN